MPSSTNNEKKLNKVFVLSNSALSHPLTRHARIKSTLILSLHHLLLPPMKFNSLAPFFSFIYIFTKQLVQFAK